MHNQMIIYKKIDEDSLVKQIRFIQAGMPNISDEGERANKIAEFVSGLINIGEAHGFRGNLWADYLTNLMVNDENAYSTACEIGGSASGTINDFVMMDMKQIYDLFHIDLKSLFEKEKCAKLGGILDYSITIESKVYNSRIRDHICELADELSTAKDVSAFKAIITAFYNKYGVGKFGLHKAFRIEENKEGSVDITPILKIAHVSLDDIVGYESQKKKLVDNTEAFVGRRPTNNCLLYGDAGTGKSSSIKAITNEYYEKGLRIIEVYRHQFKYLNDLIAQIKDRNYRFVIYMDDLSFEDFETEYKYLKAVIEGGLEKKPENVLIYATSNRRHLVKETVSDRDDMDPDMHRSDTMAEKLSLAARFGVSIYFGKPNKNEFNGIVSALAKRNGVNMSEDELLLEANKWELGHGGMSGRCAQQFIDYICGLPERTK